MVCARAPATAIPTSLPRPHCNTSIAPTASAIGSTLPNSTAFAWAYTAAGRLQTQSDPLTGATVHPDATYQSNKVEKLYYPSAVTYNTWTEAFDTYGRVASITLPVTMFAYTGSQFDLGDGVTQHTASGYVPPAPPAQYTSSQLVCLQSSIRNEKTSLALQQQTYCTMGPGPPQEINGTQFAPLPPNRFTAAQNWTLDARAGMLLHDTQPLGSDTMGSSYAYDSSGRLNQDFEGGAEQTTISAQPKLTQAWCPGVSPPAYAAVTCYSNGSRSKTYDAENRLRTETFTYQPYITATGGPTYSTTPYGFAEYGAYWADSSGYGQPANIQAVEYGATSHPMRFSLYHPDRAGTPAETRAWLWDGNDRFIECQLTNGSCQNTWLSLEGLGDYDLSHNTLVSVNDRNRNGQVAMNRTSAAFSGWSDYPARSRRNVYSPSSGSCAATVYAPNGVCAKQHDGKLTADGWSLDYETWQGVRTYDPAVGQWNTPDAYAGEVHDPISQKPFMWNRNNQYQYADPSGYDAIITVSGNNVSIVVPITFKNGTEAQRSAFKKAVERQWSGKFGSYHVSTKVTEGAMNSVTFDSSVARSTTGGTMSNGVAHYTDAVIGSREDEARHETGHLLGLGEQYKDRKSDDGKTTVSVPNPGFGRNVMGSPTGTEVTPAQVESIISSPQNTVQRTTQ